jgi:hypothetical protein
MGDDDLLDRMQYGPSPGKLRTLWQGIKARHAKVLEAGNVKFGQNLGPLLEKRAQLYKPISNTARFRKPRATALKQLLGPARLNDPARKEINTVLSASRSGPRPIWSWPGSSRSA